MKTVPLCLQTVKKLPESPGVYFVYSSDGTKLLYIGQTINFRSRFHHHFSRNRFHCDSVRLEMQKIPDKITRIETERSLILKHRPPLNRQISTRNYESRIRIFNADVYAGILTDPHLVDMNFTSAFGPCTIEMYSCPTNGYEPHYAATTIQPDGSIIVTNKRERAFITNSAWEWHALKYYLRRIPGSNGAHEHAHENGDRRWGDWYYIDHPDSVLLIHQYAPKSWKREEYQIENFSQLSRAEYEAEEKYLIAAGLSHHVPSMWAAAEVFLRQHVNGATR